MAQGTLQFTSNFPGAGLATFTLATPTASKPAAGATCRARIVNPNATASSTATDAAIDAGTTRDRRRGGTSTSAGAGCPVAMAGSNSHSADDVFGGGGG